jgi:hypothetical protein
MPKLVRLLLGINSPSRLAISDSFEVAVLWMQYRMSKRFPLYKKLIGPPYPISIAHYKMSNEMRQLQQGIRDGLMKKRSGRDDLSVAINANYLPQRARARPGEHQ